MWIYDFVKAIDPEILVVDETDLWDSEIRGETLNPKNAPNNKLNAHAN